jgi:hypothetical protein
MLSLTSGKGKSACSYYLFLVNIATDVLFNRTGKIKLNKMNSVCKGAIKTFSLIAEGQMVKNPMESKKRLK